MPRDLRQERTTEECLENGVRTRPDRYLAERDVDGRLVSVVDADTGPTPTGCCSWSRLWEQECAGRSLRLARA